MDHKNNLNFPDDVQMSNDAKDLICAFLSDRYMCDLWPTKHKPMTSGIPRLLQSVTPHFSHFPVEAMLLPFKGRVQTKARFSCVLYTEQK